MKLFDIIKKVGGGVISSVVPGGGLLVGAINSFLPGDKQLPLDATGHQIGDVVETLSGSEKASILKKEFDVQITEIKEGNETLREMLKSDAENPQSTRPYIAKHAFHVIAAVNIIVILVWAIGVLMDNDKIVAAVIESPYFILALIGPLVTVLLAYFGHLVKEHKNKMDAANGAAVPSGLAGIVSSFLKK